MKTSLSLAALFFCLTLFANPKVDALFAEYTGKVPGASVVVAQGGKILYEKSFGQADLENLIGASPQTNYRLASLSKAFTALAAMILMDEGRLSPSSRLTEIIDDFPNYGRAITVSHLIHHLSGLRDYEDLIPVGTTQQLKDIDVVEILKRQSSTYFSPGSQYRYSNSGYAVLAHIVERVSGQTFATFLEERIFRPLGMKNTVAFEDGISTVADRAFGYSPSGAGFKRTDQSLTSAVLGDGGVYTSTRELLLWNEMLSKNGLLSETAFAKIFLPAQTTTGQRVDYGYGWMLGNYRGLKRQHHTGSTIGFRTALQRYPEKNFFVAVLVNRANSSPWTLAERIADIYLFP